MSCSFRHQAGQAFFILHIHSIDLLRDHLLAWLQRREPLLSLSHKAPTNRAMIGLKQPKSLSAPLSGAKRLGPSGDGVWICSVQISSASRFEISPKKSLADIPFRLRLSLLGTYRVSTTTEAGTTTRISIAIANTVSLGFVRC